MEIYSNDLHSVGSDTTIHPEPNQDIYLEGNASNLHIDDLASVNGHTYRTNEQLALRIDSFGRITNSNVTGVTFDITPTVVTQVTYQPVGTTDVEYYVTYTNVSGAWTQRFYTVTGHSPSAGPFHTVRIT